MKKHAHNATASGLPPEIRPEQSVELLKELHILTRDGKLNQDSRRKLKQVYHLYQFIAPLLDEVLAENADLTLADHGAGKSYLGFILYDLFFKARDSGRIFGIETRAELVDKSRELARRLGFARMAFLNLTVEESITSSKLPAHVDIVTALHACDTATDDAIRFALDKQARYMVLVPCCQAEVATVLRRNKNTSFGKTPLVGWEHSMKNELIIARRTGHPRRDAEDRLKAILHELNLDELQSRFVIERVA